MKDFKFMIYHIQFGYLENGGHTENTLQVKV